METPLRVGLIVPSSNTTVETELPELLMRHESQRFTFHSSRMTMTQVTTEGLRAMNAQRPRCVTELADLSPDVLLYACLVAIMAAGPGEHRRAERLVQADLAAAGKQAAVVSSAGALTESLDALGAQKICIVTPYSLPLARQVVSYIDAEGFDVVDWKALEVEDNHAVGRIPGNRVLDAARSLDLKDADVLIISACVQMPSLSLISPAEQELGIPVISAATAGAYSILKATDTLRPIRDAGVLLSGGVG